MLVLLYNAIAVAMSLVKAVGTTGTVTSFLRHMLVLLCELIAIVLCLAKVLSLAKEVGTTVTIPFFLLFCYSIEL